MQWAKRKQTGFTIVELLIVVVVIAILAAITIVAYTGIQQRAKESVAKDAAAGVTQKILTYAVDNSDNYPGDLATLATVLGLPAPASGATKLTAADGTTYQYTVNNSTSPKSYCTTTTKSGLSYYVNSATGNSPAKGACAGHGVNGVDPVTNLVLNPRPDSAYWFPSSSGVAGVTFVGSGVNSAARSTRITTASYGLYSSRSSFVTTAQAGDVYTILFTISSSITTNITFQIGYGTATASISSLNLPLALTAGVPQTIRQTITIPSGYDGQPIFNKFLWGEGAAGDSFDVSKVMWVKGNYAPA